MYPGATCSFHSEPFNTLRHSTCRAHSCNDLRLDLQRSACATGDGSWKVMFCLRFLANIPHEQLPTNLVTYDHLWNHKVGMEWNFMIATGKSGANADAFVKIQNPCRFHETPPRNHSAVRDFPHIWDHTLGVFNIRSMGWIIETVHDHVCFGPTKISSHSPQFFSKFHQSAGGFWPGPVGFRPGHLWLPSGNLT